MKAIIAISIFLVIFSFAKSFVSNMEGTITVLERNASRTEAFYNQNK